jgi:hypothetical protein
MMMNYVIYPSHITQVTEKAFQCRIDDDLFWFPKSQTKAMKRGKEYKVILPQWLASKNGLLAKRYNGENVYFIQTTEEEV